MILGDIFLISFVHFAFFKCLPEMCMTFIFCLLQLHMEFMDSSATSMICTCTWIICRLQCRCLLLPILCHILPDTSTNLPTAIYANNVGESLSASFLNFTLPCSGISWDVAAPEKPSLFGQWVKSTPSAVLQPCLLSPKLLELSVGLCLCLFIFLLSLSQLSRL